MPPPGTRALGDRGAARGGQGCMYAHAHPLTCVWHVHSMRVQVRALGDRGAARGGPGGRRPFERGAGGAARRGGGGGGAHPAGRRRVDAGDVHGTREHAPPMRATPMCLASCAWHVHDMCTGTSPGSCRCAGSARTGRRRSPSTAPPRTSSANARATRRRARWRRRGCRRRRATRRRGRRSISRRSPPRPRAVGGRSSHAVAERVWPRPSQVTRVEVSDSLVSELH